MSPTRTSLLFRFHEIFAVTKDRKVTRLKIVGDALLQVIIWNVFIWIFDLTKNFVGCCFVGYIIKKLAVFFVNWNLLVCFSRSAVFFFFYSFWCLLRAHTLYYKALWPHYCCWRDHSALKIQKYCNSKSPGPKTPSNNWIGLLDDFHFLGVNFFSNHYMENNIKMNSWNWPNIWKVISRQSNGQNQELLKMLKALSLNLRF